MEIQNKTSKSGQKVAVNRDQGQILIYGSDEYDRFVYDRNKDENRVLDLINKIGEHNLLMLYPIIVTPDYKVLDGEIRLEAARRLDVKIYYIITTEMQEHDRELVDDPRTKKDIQLPEVLRYYVCKGYDEYIKVKRFVDKTGLPIYASVGLLVGSSAQPGRSIVNRFKNGQFVVTHADTAMRIHSMLNDFSAFISDDIIRQRVFINAVSTLATYISPDGHQYDHKRMMNKLQQAAGLITNTTKKSGYLKMFASVYEYKERNKSAANCPSFRDAIN